MGRRNRRHPGRGLGPSVGTMRILRLTPQDDKSLGRDDGDSSTRCRSLGMTILMVRAEGQEAGVAGANDIMLSA